MWRTKKVAVIFPTFREKESIAKVVRDFNASGYVDEIIVVDNNAEKGTRENLRKTSTKIITEPRQGLGMAIRTGIKNTKADIIIISEPDGTFKGQDVAKLLAYSDDFDVVFGSRTHLPLIEKNSQMHLLRRTLDVLLGKMISFLFLCPPLTDVGCIFRLTTRKGWRRVVKECQADDALFVTQWQLIAAKNKVRFMEIPVNFKKRVGVSSITATFKDQTYWGIRIFLYIWKVWFYHKLRRTLL